MAHGLHDDHYFTVHPLPRFAGSGGISLKPSPSMDAMRADMGGAATVCASIVTAAALKLPVNIIGEVSTIWILPPSAYQGKGLKDF